MKEKTTHRDLRLSNQLPEGFDQRFFNKLKEVKLAPHQKQDLITPPSFFAQIKASLAPMVFATCLVVVVVNQTRRNLSAAREIQQLVEDVSSDISTLDDENWDILLQVADNS